MPASELNRSTFYLSCQYLWHDINFCIAIFQKWLMPCANYVFDRMRFSCVNVVDVTKYRRLKWHKSPCTKWMQTAWRLQYSHHEAVGTGCHIGHTRCTLLLYQKCVVIKSSCIVKHPLQQFRSYNMWFLAETRNHSSAIKPRFHCHHIVTK